MQTLLLSVKRKVSVISAVKTSPIKIRSDTQHRQAIRLVEASAADLSALGQVIGVPTGVAHRSSGFYGDAVKLWSPVDFVSDSDTTLSVARIEPRANEIVYLERHFKHTQAFIPLGGKPFVAVMAPATVEGLPDPATAKAYLFRGDAGFLMRIGTWHEFPFALVPETDVIIILRNQTSRNLTAVEHGEAIGADLEKRNLQARLDRVLTFDIQGSVQTASHKQEAWRSQSSV